MKSTIRAKYFIDRHSLKILLINVSIVQGHCESCRMIRASMGL